MACDTPINSPRGRQGIGVIQPQSGLDYPFVAPSSDIRELVADFYLEYDDPGFYAPIPQIRHPLKIKWLYGVGCIDNSPVPDMPTPVNAADILVVDSNDAVVFDSTAADSGNTPKLFTQKNWGNDYKIYEWIGVDAVCRLVIYTTQAPDQIMPQNYPKNFAPVNAVLDARAVYKIPKRVKTLKVLLNTIRGKEVDIVSGYNFLTTYDAAITEDLRHKNQIVFNAEPGFGLGKYSDCADTSPVIVKLNGVTGSNVNISAADCIWTQVNTQFNQNETAIAPVIEDSANPAIYPRGTGTLVLGSNCGACCSCDDYVNVGRYMNCVHGRYGNIGGVAKSVLAQHSLNIDRWLAQRECRIQKPIKLAMTPQRCPTADIVVQYCNLCETCAEDVTINLHVATYPSAGASGYIEQCYSVISSENAKNAPYIVAGTWPNFSINFGKVSGGNSASASFRIRITPATPPRTVYVTAAGSYRRGGNFYPIVNGCDPINNTPATATVGRPLACTETGATATVC